MIGWTPAAQAILDSGQSAWFCDLYRIVLVDQTVILWTGAETDQLVDGEVYRAGPLIERERIALKQGLETDRLTITIHPTAADTLAGVPLSKALLGGLFDGALVSVWRAIAVGPGQPIVGAVGKFLGGKVGVVSGTGFEVRLEVFSALWRLGQPFPRRVYSPSCSHQLFDGLCQLNRASFKTRAIVAAFTADRMTVQTDATAFGLNYFRFGVAECTIGANAGRALRIKESVNGLLKFAQPWGSAIDYADEFSIYPGCDKTLSMCETRFNNRLHFGGQPYIPAAELLT